MTWEAFDPRGEQTGNTVQMPMLFCVLAEIYSKVFGNEIDGTSSDPRTLDLLSNLVVFSRPKVVVEVGTYRGWGTAMLAETMRFHDIPGHVWSCDPVDYGVSELLEKLELTDRVTLLTGTFEKLLEVLPPIDFCYIDASDKDEGSLRVRYANLALDHAAKDALIVVDDAGGEWEGAKTIQRMADLYLPQYRGLAIVRKT